MKRTEEVGECIEWQGYFQNKTPHVQNEGNMVPVRKLIMELLGNTQKERMFYSVSCGNRACVNPKHIVYRTMKDHATHMAKKVDANAPTRIFKLQKSAEKRRALNEQQIMQVRTDNRSCSEVAVLFGVSKSLISKIRRGKSNRMVNAQNNPFWGLMA